MCIPLEIQGQSVGHVLVDSGATRTVARETAIAGIRDRIAMQKVKNMYVLGSTGKEIPIIGRFLCDLTSNEQVLGRTFVYVVQNTPRDDIICDFVLGRATLAESAYPYVDVRGQGSIYNEVTKKRLMCLPCHFIKDGQGVRQLTPTPHNSAENIVERTVRDKHETEIASISDHVRGLSHLEPAQQEYLLAHLLSKKGHYKIIVDPTKKEEVRKRHELEFFMFNTEDESSTREQFAVDYLMTRLSKGVPELLKAAKEMAKGLKKSKAREADDDSTSVLLAAITEMFSPCATTPVMATHADYVPEVVQKKRTCGADTDGVTASRHHRR